jgi:hypothetical protein
MLGRVAFVRTDISEKLGAFFIKVTLMKEALSSSEMSVITRVTPRNIPEDAIINM